MNMCYIFGSLDVNSFPFSVDSDDFVIAADRGLLNAEKFNIKPDLIVGDFDSLNYIPQGKNVIKHPVMKDETDLILAVETALKKGYKNFYIFGCIGGRLDQTFATIQTADYIHNNGGNALLFGDNIKISILYENETLSFSSKNSGIISVFSYSEKANVSIKGLLYELDKAQIDQSYPLGVSNEFKCCDAEIKVNSGKALIIWNYNKFSGERLING